MTMEAGQAEFAYYVRIEIRTGQSADLPVVFLTPKQLEHFLQLDFNRLAEEAGIKGARIFIERAMTADYREVLNDVAACLKTAKAKAA